MIDFKNLRNSTSRDCVLLGCNDQMQDGGIRRAEEVYGKPLMFDRERGVSLVLYLGEG